AIAAVLGLCLGTSVFTTLIWFTAAQNTSWVLPLVAAMSIALWLGRSFRTEGDARTTTSSADSRLSRFSGSLRARDVAGLAVVCVVVAAPLSYTLHERHSVGPVGFEVWDAVDYTAESDAMEKQSLQQAVHPYSARAVRG